MKQSFFYCKCYTLLNINQKINVRIASLSFIDWLDFQCYCMGQMDLATIEFYADYYSSSDFREYYLDVR